VIEETSDKEIYQAVLAAHKAQEEGPINGGDNNVEDDAPLEPCLTYHEVFQAASIIGRYAGHIDDPTPCKLKAVLASFKCQMQLEVADTDHYPNY